MAAQLSRTLPELLHGRSLDSTAELGFLDTNGTITKNVTYTDLFNDARDYAQRLLAFGLKPNGEDIVIANFLDHESHILLFWGCCLARIPICPIPPLHPDPSRQLLFLKHLQTLFNSPTLIALEETIQIVKSLVPEFKTVSPGQLSTLNAEEFAREVYPTKYPESNDDVCFMLTSGSTGNSKAAALTHSNLLSSIRGKIKHHGSTSNSRFLNWIAFDHVACVSEIHLQALEANASQYHISPSSIIQYPQRLLELSSRLKITYTFSPNFLIAQICRSSSSIHEDSIDLSHIRAFISGGEAVPTKTAVEFSDVIERLGAPRNALRAGFGMTETGAGCIYDTRENPKNVDLYPAKYLSLGKCCDGVSMRIVDIDTGLACPPFCSGQLQVKGPTVFRRYFNNDQATAESFTDDWFFTGDVAQLDEEGNLHLMGRDKDCININGVKHPSVDVEHYIEDAKIEGILKSFVYVCPLRLPDADTETYGVFYQHLVPVDSDLDDESRNSIIVTNRSIKAACTIFCSQAPHVILPLPGTSFVKTALGKISRSYLSKAYLEGVYKPVEVLLTESSGSTDSAEDGPLSHVENVVFEGVATIFDVDKRALKRSQNLFDIGASSMHLMRLKHFLQEQFSIPDLPTIEMLKRPEIGQLSEYIIKLVAKDVQAITPETSYNPLVCFNPHGTKPPVFLIHPGVGEVLVFINLARVLHDDRPIYALRARGFDYGDRTFTSFEEMVDSYTFAIESQYPSGPYFLAGYSFGGAVAFEIGKRLEARGKRVAWVGILNLPPHIQFRMRELVWVEVLLNLCMFLSLISTYDFEGLKTDVQNAFPELSSSDSEPLSVVQIICWVFERCNQARLKELQMKTEEFSRWVRVAYDITHSGRSYQPEGVVRGALTTIFCATPLPSMGSREEYKRTMLSAWSEFSSAFEMVDVDGEHYTMVSEDHVDSFAEKMRAAMARAEDLTAPAITPAHNSKADFDEVPIIDFSLSETNVPEYIRQLKYALEDVGFGIFVNVPGFESGFQKELFELADRLYSKPQEWKDSLGTGNSYALRGYFRTDNIAGPHKAYAEAYRFGADLPHPVAKNGSSVPFWLRLHEGPNQWPSEDEVPQFRSKMEILFKQYHDLNLTLNRHICQLLDIPQSILDDFFPEKIEFNSAIWHYLPVTPEIQREASNGFAQGMHEHRDPSTFLTCLIQSRPGLQVQNHSGKWIDIPMVEGGVVCNIGMQLMKLTGGKLVATTHRVNTLKIEKDRYTIPYVLSTRLEKPVVPLPQFENPEIAKLHVAPNPKIQKLMSIEDPLVRSGYARLSLFPAATQKLYPIEFEEARHLGIV